MALDIELLKNCVKDYKYNLSKHKKMANYYDGQHDIYSTYDKLDSQSNEIIVDNYVQTLIDQETAMVLGNPLTYTSYKQDKESINTIMYNLAHYSKKFDQRLLTEAEIHSEAYELNYISSDGDFSGIILNPLNAYVLLDDYGQVELFFHFFKKRFETGSFNYIDVYDNENIYHYTKDFTLIGVDRHYFYEVPVSILKIDTTVYQKIKSKQDALNKILSSNFNLIEDFRAAHLVFEGCDINKEQLAEMKTMGIIKTPTKDSKVSWLTKDVNDTHIMNMINQLIEEIFAITSHVSTPKMQSNVSGSALSGRMISLVHRCSLVADSLRDAVHHRVKLLFNYVNIKTGKQYNYKDIQIKITNNIPHDLNSLADTVSKLQSVIPIKKLYEILPFIDNPEYVYQLWQEQNDQMVDLDSIIDDTGDDADV